MRGVMFAAKTVELALIIAVAKRSAEDEILALPCTIGCGLFCLCDFGGERGGWPDAADA